MGFFYVETNFNADEKNLCCMSKLELYNWNFEVRSISFHPLILLEINLFIRPR